MILHHGMHVNYKSTLYFDELCLTVVSVGNTERYKKVKWPYPSFIYLFIIYSSDCRLKLKPIRQTSRMPRLVCGWRRSAEVGPSNRFLLTAHRCWCYLELSTGLRVISQCPAFLLKAPSSPFPIKNLNTVLC